MAHSTTHLEMGSKAHHFALLDTVSDKLISLNDVASKKATVIMFLCNHCPYVKHILPKLIDVANTYIAKGVSFVAISSNDVQIQPQDGPDEMGVLADEMDFPFPYLYDQTQMVARHYMAECTPEFFVYDGNMRLAYHGQFDGSRPNNGVPVTGQDLSQALDLLLENKPAPEHQQPSVGCSIKWKV